MKMKGRAGVWSIRATPSCNSLKETLNTWSGSSLIPVLQVGMIISTYVVQTRIESLIVLKSRLKIPRVMSKSYPKWDFQFTTYNHYGFFFSHTLPSTIAFKLECALFHQFYLKIHFLSRTVWFVSLSMPLTLKSRKILMSKRHPDVMHESPLTTIRCKTTFPCSSCSCHVKIPGLSCG